jgi:hypothetical protein
VARVSKILSVRTTSTLATAFLGVLVLAAGCAADPRPTVAGRASFDLECPPESILVSEGGRCTFYARGCGKKAAYIVMPAYYRSMVCCPAAGCTAILNGNVSPVEAPPRAP